MSAVNGKNISSLSQMQQHNYCRIFQHKMLQCCCSLLKIKNVKSYISGIKEECLEIPRDISPDGLGYAFFIVPEH